MLGSCVQKYWAEAREIFTEHVKSCELKFLPHTKGSFLLKERLRDVGLEHFAAW
jgi:hypothetical protein